MEFDQYVVARRRRLVEYAGELGVDDEQATELVGRVLQEQRRAIGRADDPDPGVRRALREAVLGKPRRSILGPVAVAVLVLVVATVAIRFLSLDPATTPTVPSTYTLDAARATATLTDAGFEVETRDVELCETADQVIGTEPIAGTAAAKGSAVIVLVARPPGLSCPPGADFRAMVWQFLRWVRGLGPAPALVDEPSVVVIDDEGTRTTQLDRSELVRRIDDGQLLGALRDVVANVAPTPSGFPELTVRNGAQAPPCGASPPAAYDQLLTIRFDLDATAAGTDGCPLTGYLVPDGALLATVVLLVPAN